MPTVLWAPNISVFDLILQGSEGVPLGVGGVLPVGMYRLVPNWWVQSGAGECKGSRPALPVHHTTVVLHRSYHAACILRPYRYTYTQADTTGLGVPYYHWSCVIELG